MSSSSNNFGSLLGGTLGRGVRRARNVATTALGGLQTGAKAVGDQVGGAYQGFRRGLFPNAAKGGTQTWAPDASTQNLMKNHPMYAAPEEEEEEENTTPQQPMQPQPAPQPAPQKPWKQGIDPETGKRLSTPSDDTGEYVNVGGQQVFKSRSGSIADLGKSYRDPDTGDVFHSRYDSRERRDPSGTGPEKLRYNLGANAQGLVPTWGDVDGKFQVTGMRPMTPEELANRHLTSDQMAQAPANQPQPAPNQPQAPANQPQPAEESPYIVDQAMGPVAEGAKSLAKNPFMPFQKGLEGLSHLSGGGLGALADRAHQALQGAAPAPQAPQGAPAPQAPQGAPATAQAPQAVPAPPPPEQVSPPLPVAEDPSDYYVGDYSRDPETNPYAPAPGTVPDSDLNQPGGPQFPTFAPAPVTAPDLAPEENFDPFAYDLEPEFTEEEEERRRNEGILREAQRLGIANRLGLG